MDQIIIRNFRHYTPTRLETSSKMASVIGCEFNRQIYDKTQKKTKGNLSGKY